MYTLNSVPPQTAEKVEMNEIVEMLKNPEFIKYIQMFKEEKKTEEVVKETPIQVEKVLTLEEHKKLYSQFLRIKRRNRRNMMIRKFKNISIAKSCRQFDPIYYENTMKQCIKKHNEVANDNRVDYKELKSVNDTYFKQRQDDILLSPTAKVLDNQYEKIRNERRSDFVINTNKTMDIKDFLDIFILPNKSKVEFEKLSEILPKNNHQSIYYVSYFTAFMKNESIKLLPFIVKLNKQTNNYQNLDFYQHLQKMISTFGLKDLFEHKKYSIDQVIEFSTLSEKDKKIVYKHFIPKMKDIIGGGIGPDDSRSMGPDYIYNESKQFYVLDNEFTLQFYKFYLKMYGEENIDNIDFIWNCKDNELKEGEEDFISISPHLYNYDGLRPSDFNIIEEEYIERYNIHQYCFNINELYDFKDSYPYRLENCFEYSFGEGIEIEEILSFFDDFKKYNLSKQKFKNTLKSTKDKKIVYESTKDLINTMTQNRLNDKNIIPDIRKIRKLELEPLKFFSQFDEKNDSFNNVRPWDSNFQKIEIFETSHHDGHLTNIDSFCPCININQETKELDDYFNLSVNLSGDPSLINKCGIIENPTNIQKIQKSKTYVHLYHKDKKESMLFEFDISPELNIILHNNFDIWFGNDFDFIKILTSDSIQCDIKLLMETFHLKTFDKKQMIYDEWKYMERKVFKQKDGEKLSSKLSIEECASIIKKHFHINDDPNNRIRSTELSTMFIEIINDELLNKNKYVDDEYIISIFVDIVKELGLKKKRYSAGNFYYGIEKKKD